MLKLYSSWMGSSAYRARIALALAAACDIQPLGVVRIRDYIANEIHLSQAQQQQWLSHWVTLGFEALETQLQSPETGRCCQGDAPGMADCVLIPQVYKAHEANMDMSRYPTVERIYQYCQTLDAFTKTRPDRQPDAPAT